jgi:ATP-dependent Clp endopeptidase proteolytic subunit ClpP
MFWKFNNKQENEEETETEEESEVVRIIDTDVFFYGDVDTANVMELNTKLMKLTKTLRKKAVSLTGYEPRITLHIRSDGGDVFAGLSAMDHISASTVPIDTIADGMCASAATFILMGGSKRYIRPSGYLLIHQMYSEAWGKYEEMKDEMKNCEKMMKIIKNIYETRTSIPTKKLNAMMKRDIYLTATECLKYEIVDEICPGIVYTNTSQSE